METEENYMNDLFEEWIELYPEEAKKELIRAKEALEEISIWVRDKKEYGFLYSRIPEHRFNVFNALEKVRNVAKSALMQIEQDFQDWVNG